MRWGRGAGGRWRREGRGGKSWRERWGEERGRERQEKKNSIELGKCKMFPKEIIMKRSCPPLYPWMQGDLMCKTRMYLGWPLPVAHGCTLDRTLPGSLSCRSWQASYQERSETSCCPAPHRRCLQERTSHKMCCKPYVSQMILGCSKMGRKSDRPSPQLHRCMPGSSRSPRCWLAWLRNLPAGQPLLPRHSGAHSRKC